MGTRGSIGVLLNNKFTGIYNHFDSYPSSLGVEVVEFVNKVNNEKDGWKKFKKNFATVKEVTDDEKPTKKEIEKYEQYSDTRVSTGSLEEWYCLLRKIQGVETFNEIYKGKLKHIIAANNFIKIHCFANMPMC